MAGYSGDGSLNNLLLYVTGGTDSKRTFTIKYKEYNIQVLPDEKVIQDIFSFYRAGRYYYSQSWGHNRNTNGRFWESYAASSSRSSGFSIDSSSLNPEDDGYKGTGFSLRCVAK